MKRVAADSPGGSVDDTTAESDRSITPELAKVGVKAGGGKNFAPATPFWQSKPFLAAAAVTCSLILLLAVLPPALPRGGPSAGGNGSHLPSQEEGVWSGLAVSDPAAFLRELLPLRVLSFIPGNGTQLAATAAIAIVFSKSVIAIGSDAWSSGAVPENIHFGCAAAVPGRWRWVSTSILRFDPSAPWPNDLRCTVAVAPDFISWDGSAIGAADATALTATYTTPTLAFNVAGVESAAMDAATDGHWDGGFDVDSPEGGTRAFEVPPDGNAMLSFNVAVLPELVATSLQVLPAGPKFVLNGSCAGTASHSTEVNCLRGYFSPPLSGNTAHTLWFPSGSVVSRGGPLQASVSATTWGVLPFAFMPRRYNATMGSRTLALYLRHGLASTTRPERIAAVTAVQPSAGPITARVLNKWTLLLVLPELHPATTYTLTILGTDAVRDALGQALQTSTLTFATSSIDDAEIFDVSDIAAVSRYWGPTPSFGLNRTTQWPVFRRGQLQRGEQLAYYRFGSQVAAEAFLAGSSNAAADVTIDTTTPMDEVSSDSKLRTVSLGVRGLFGLGAAQGVVIRRGTTPSYLGYWGTQGRLADTVFGDPTIALNIHVTANRASAWLLNISGSQPQPIPDAQVTFFWQGQSDRMRRKVGASSTDAMGLASQALQASGQGAVGVLASIVGVPAAFAEGPAGVSSGWDGSQLNAVLTTDRAMYRLGETVLVSGVLRSVSTAGGSLTIPPQTNITFQVDWTGTGDDRYHVSSLSDAFGVVQGRLQVPATATFGEHYLNALVGSQYIGGVRIIVADPRVPTSILKCAAAADVLLAQDITHSPPRIRCIATTYLGAPLDGAAISVSCSGSVSSSSGVVTIGTIGLTSNASGWAESTVSVPSGAVPQSPSEVGELNCRATYVAPTRETLTADVHFAIWSALISLTVESVPSDAIPGVPVNIGVLVDTSNNVNQPCQTPLVTLLEAPGPAPCVSLGRQDNLEHLVCSVTLPAPGVFTAQVSAKDAQGNSAVTTVQLGRTEDDWRAAPLAALPAIRASLSSSNVNAGDAVSISFDSAPFVRPFTALVQCGTDVRKLVTSSAAQSSFVLPAECVRPSVETVNVLIQTGTLPAAPAFRESAVLSATAQLQLPQFTSTALPIRTRTPPPLTAAIEFGPQVGSTRSIRVSAKNAQGTGIDGEAIVFVVDRAVLDLAPLPELDVTELSRSPAASLQTVAAVSNNLSPIRAALLSDRLRTLTLRHPWLSLPSFNLDTDIDTLLVQLRAELTEFPWRGMVMMAEADVGVAGGFAVKTSVASTNVARAAASAVPVRFQATDKPATLAAATIQLQRGVGVLSIPLGDYLGTWDVRVIAVARNASDGVATAQSSFEVRKPVSLAPSSPRFVRFGDNFSAGVVVTSLDATEQVTVALNEVCEGLVPARALRSTVTVVPNQPTEVVFPFIALRYETECVLAFSLSSTATGVQLDRLDVHVPVLAPLATRTSGTAFALSGGATATEGLALPPAVPSSGSIDVMTTGSHLSSVWSLLASSSEELKTVPQRSSAVLTYCECLLAALPYSAAGGSDAATFFGSGAWLNISVSVLTANTQMGIGLVDSPDPYAFSTWWVDLELNARAVRLVRQLKAVGVDARIWLDGSLIARWKSAIETGLTRRNPDDGSLLQPQTPASTLRLYELLGTTYGLPATASTFPQLVAIRAELDLGSQARLAAVLVETGDEEDAEVALSLTEQLVDAIRLVGRTAYIGGSPSTVGGVQGQPLGMDAQSNALRAFSFFAAQGTDLSIRTADLQSRLALYVAVGSGTAVDWWMFQSARGDRALALSAYDQRVSMTLNPSLQVSILGNTSRGMLPLYIVPFTSAADLAHIDDHRFSWEDFAGSAGVLPSIGASASGAGEAVVTITMSYAPLPPAVPVTVYQGIFVQKSLEQIQSNGSSKAYLPETVLSVGDLLKVTVSVTIVDALQGVQIQDFLPGGLEAVDPDLSGGQPSLQSDVSGDWARWWWFIAGFGAPEVRADQVQCTAPYLGPGTYSCSYFARAVTSGHFIFPGAEASMLTQPEVRGASAHAFVTVRER